MSAGVLISLAALLLGGCASAPPADAPSVVKAGSPVELAIRKEGLIPHTFTISAPAAGVSADIALSSERSLVAFTPKAPGTYPFVCTQKLLFFASHAERGMRGVLEVVP